MDRLGDGYLHVPINARSGIPAATRKLRVVHTNGKHVSPGEVEGRRQIKAETCICVGMNAELFAIEIHGGVARDPIKLDADPLSFPVRRCSKCLSIPAHAGGKESSPDPV